MRKIIIFILLIFINRGEANSIKEAYYNFCVSKLYSFNQDFDNSIKYLKKAIELDNNVSVLYSELALDYLYIGNFDEAFNQAKFSIKLNPDIFLNNFVIGKIFVAKNDLDLSIKHFEKARLLNKHVIEIYYYLSSLYSQSGNANKMIEVLMEFIKLYPENYEGYFLLGEAYLKNKNINEAKIYYKRALDIYPEYEQALKALGNLEVDDKNISAAIYYFEQLSRLNSSDIELRRYLSNLYINMKNYEKAVNELKEIIKLVPYNIESRKELTILLFNLKQYNETKIEISEILKLNPKEIESRYILVKIYENEFNFDGAIKLLHEIISIKAEEYVQATIEESFIFYAHKKDLNSALKILNDALLKKPKSVDLYLATSQIYDNEKRYHESIDVLKKAKKIVRDKKDIERVEFTLGVIYDKNGEWKNAISSMENVLKINPQNAYALNHIGYTYADKNIELEKAEKFLTQAISMQPEDGYIIDSLGWLYFKQGKLEEAIATLEKAVKTNNNEPIIIEHLADAYYKNGQQKRAQEMYEKARDILLKQNEKDKINAINKKINELEGGK
jgi:tetratricopeptide (TPR) repeat protein